MTDRLPPTVTEAESETLDMRGERKTFLAGEIVGDRYQILALLGRGGMGEVWQAFDLKLRVDVALKALRSDIFKNERRRESLRQEVRSARDVVSPNVCRLYDLHEMEGLELVSMEFVDGQTLLDVMWERAPLDLQEAQDIASQFLAGLEAIHHIGLVHRDIKPENIMLTRAGRVVVMDFGIAREEAEGSGTVSGTAAYMAPEQAAGQAVDARADIYSAGVVLAEMVNPEGLKNRESRESVWEAVRAEPAKIPDSPWATVITKAVAKDRDHRFDSAADLTRALEDVTLRVIGADNLHPYPGLAAFTEDDAEYFFGREAEVEQMWRKLEGPPRMLGLVGPSGAGKSSFIAAGLAAHAPTAWEIIRSTPGNAAISSLGAAVARETAGDPNAVELLPRFGKADVAVDLISRWAGRSSHSLLIVDQFEELFTQNSVDEQIRFTEMLKRFVLEADVHVLLSMRDDFAVSCNNHEPLRPIFHELTVLNSPAGANLRRALVKPALACSYRFEDDELVDEMLIEVEGERGALPLLAFAAARLWDMRDRKTGLLTRQTYQDIGGVGGALAQHAEATIDRIGIERIPIVRELFRNLVTAEGTRALREWDELLSVFEEAQREPAAEVLRKLVQARLLTSYEVREDEHEPRRRVEIIHESLLATWPRLVRWQTQDADSVQLREQLRQAAKTWNEQGRSDDTLWTGSAYREFESWRERFTGGLSKAEEAFAAAMRALAARRRNRRRFAVATIIVVLLAVLSVVGISRQKAIAEARRAEASKLVMLGNSVLEEGRTQALAYSIAALEHNDSKPARHLATKSLWAGPPATFLPFEQGAWSIDFDTNGDRMAVGHSTGLLRVYPRDGGPVITLDDFEGQHGLLLPGFSADGQLFVSGASRANGEIRIWNTDSWKVNRILQTSDLVEVGQNGSLAAFGLFEPGGTSLLSISATRWTANTTIPERNFVVHRWPLKGSDPQWIGSVDVTGSLFAATRGRDAFVSAHSANLFFHHVGQTGLGTPRLIFSHPDSLDMVRRPGFDPSGERFALCDREGRLFVWDIGETNRPRVFHAPRGDPMKTSFSPDGSRLAVAIDPVGGALWDLAGPAGALPLTFDGHARYGLEFSPDGQWLMTAMGPRWQLAMWPVTNQYWRILDGHEGAISAIEFSNDGSVLYSQGASDGKVLAWPLSGMDLESPEVVYQAGPHFGTGLAIDPKGRFIIVSTDEVVLKVSLEGGSITEYDAAWKTALDNTGRYIAAQLKVSPTIVVTDLESEERWELSGPGEGHASEPYFDQEGRLLITRGGVLSRWNPIDESTEVLLEDVPWGFPYPDGRIVIPGEGKRWLIDLETGKRTEFPLKGTAGAWNVNPSGSIVARGGRDGTVSVWSFDDQILHVLLGHNGPVREPRISPDGKWIATHGADHTIRLWPMPDLSNRPFHDLPIDDLLSRLKALTNLRAVPDDEADFGYTISADFGTYSGWAEVPEW